MRLLLINPNTSPEITALVERTARGIAAPDVEIRAVTGRFGARYIASRSAAAIAGHAALDAFAEHGQDCDAVLLACFGDPGLLALRELSPVPVVGMAEAACHLACLAGARFSIVTGGERWGAMLSEFVDALGLSSRLAGVATVAPSGADIARDPDAALALLTRAAVQCVREDGAEVVILGGAGLAGLSGRIAADVPVPVLCSLDAALRATIAAAGLGPAKAETGSFSSPAPAGSVGLGPALAALMAG